MTSDVVRAGTTTPFKEVARLLAGHHISGLPVTDEDDKVMGVVSETDLLMRRAVTEEGPGTGPARRPPTGLTRGARPGGRCTARGAGGNLPPAPEGSCPGSFSGSRPGRRADPTARPRRPPPRAPAARRPAPGTCPGHGP
ncbi:CBS domain-containing protein [Streptomyces sp. NPDC005017]|uniref:CBS domain-containing protein n=1 Tax=Streptomyces sp. NPDC005017 TaxID=3364706 RepID=UPI00367ED67E